VFRLKNYSDTLTRVSKKYEDKRIRLHTIPALDGQTVGQTDGYVVKQYRSLYSMHADTRRKIAG